MAVLLDTNILLRLVQPHHPHASAAREAVQSLHEQDEELHVVSQNLIEFWAVATRPASANGLGWTTSQVAGEVATIKTLFSLLPESDLQDIWEKLVNDYEIQGKSVHDARLVAAMISNRISTLLTFNGADFSRYKQIRVIVPGNRS